MTRAAAPARTLRILLVEDNADIAGNVADYFEPLGHQLDFAMTGTLGLELASNGQYDVIILDLMLPGMDGLEVCRQIRQSAAAGVRLLMLTARDALDDKLAGFAAGADDYLVKPFSMRELEARLHALAARDERGGEEASLVVGPLRYDPLTLQASRDGVPLTLNPVQRRILTLLMRHTSRVVTRAELESHIWGQHPPAGDVLRSHIYTLRTIIDRPFAFPLLHTVHGAGYRLHDTRQEDRP